MKTLFNKKTILITGGTGSLGKTLIRRILTCELGTPKRIIVFSRDEAKQFYMQTEYNNCLNSTEEILYKNFKDIVKFVIGDVRNYDSVLGVCKQADIIINTAALKQVPTCEYYPYEAVQTNIVGVQNIINAIINNCLNVEKVIGVSTDKACKPINVMGMTKALQERLFLEANLRKCDTSFNCVRYGNVLASRGSVIPFFIEQIKNNKQITITTETMTRFLISLDDAVDVIFNTLLFANRGQTFIPIIKSAKVTDIAHALHKLDNREFKYTVTGIRPGEKEHEILVSEDERYRTKVTNELYHNKKYYVIESILNNVSSQVLTDEYSSANYLMCLEEVCKMLLDNKLTVKDFTDSNNKKDILK